MTLSPLDRDLISNRLPPNSVIGREIIIYRETASTNDVARHLGESRCPEGSVIFAETQTAGRGRQGRVWHSSESRGLWFSILLRPPAEYLQNGLLTKLTAIALADVLNADIKEPNDIFIRGKKIAGILIESCTGPNAFCILGIGLNVLQETDDFAPEIRSIATSAKLENIAIDSREALAAAILTKLEQLYRALPGNEAEIQARYQQAVKWRPPTPSEFA